MKKILSMKLFILLLLLVNLNSYADEIWSKNFADELNKGYWGMNSDVSGITDWTLDVSLCTLSNDFDYVKVVETSGGRLEAVDCDGEAVWTSRVIDISGFSNSSISVLVAETGTSTNENKYIKLFYKIDGGVEQAFSINGENIGNWGSLESKSLGISGNELVLVIRMNNPLSSNKVYFDDILITGETVVVENDKFTTITTPENQVQELFINTDYDTEEEATTCFRFIIDETDSAIDGVPTKISRMTFYNSKPTNGLNWESQLGGLRIYSEGVPVNHESLRIGADSLYFDFTEDQLSIPEGEKREFELRVYLNSEVELTDGTKFQLAIENDARGFTTYGSGSAFVESNENIRSAIHQVNVEAIKLVLLDVPETIVRNQFFELTVNAIDQFNNIDTDQDEKITLTLHTGTGELFFINESEKSLERGILIFDSLRYQTVQPIRLMVKGESLPEFISSEIIIENTFESEAISTSWISDDMNVSALQIHKSEAFKLLEFAVKDSGNDEASTELKKIPIIGSENNQVDFKKSFAGFYLVRDNQELAVDFEISRNQVDILFHNSESAAIIESETTAIYSLFAYFLEGECIDGEIIQMQIEETSADWEVSEKDSRLKPLFDKNVSGPEFICQVEAMKMQFADVPKSVKPNEMFTLEIKLLDELANVDTNV